MLGVILVALLAAGLTYVTAGAAPIVALAGYLGWSAAATVAAVTGAATAIGASVRSVWPTSAIGRTHAGRPQPELRGNGRADSFGWNSRGGQPLVSMSPGQCGSSDGGHGIPGVRAGQPR
jgi:hypothetical protein